MNTYPIEDLLRRWAISRLAEQAPSLAALDPRYVHVDSYWNHETHALHTTIKGGGRVIEDKYEGWEVIQWLEEVLAVAIGART